MPRSEALIDLGAIRDNVVRLREHTAAAVMAVVKADGYGHGLLPAARAARLGGATWFGTATLTEALQLRAGGIVEPVLAWLWTPADAPAVRACLLSNIDVSVSSTWQLEIVSALARETGATARVHLKIDTGLSRNGCYVADWPELLAATAKVQAAGAVAAVGIWSHFAWADAPGHPTIARQVARFSEAVEVAARAGIEPEVRHIANSAATLTLPDAHFDLVRPGIAVYGLSPVPGDFGLTPAMTLRSGLASVKRVAAGEGVSYGHTYVTGRETTLALVPLGYADGIARNASSVAPVSINGQRFRISGRVCMDQFVVDVGDAPVDESDTAVLFGPGRDGEPTAQDWADALDTIHYEIVTRIGPRVPRVYLDIPDVP